MEQKQLPEDFKEFIQCLNSKNDDFNGKSDVSKAQKVIAAGGHPGGEA
jgi:hypothetical protein